MSKKKQKAMATAYRQIFIEGVLDLLRKQPGTSFSFSKIAAALHIHDHDGKALLGDVLETLMDNDLLERTSSGQYSQKTTQQYITGRLELIPSGAGFVIVEGAEQDIFIASRNLNGAFEGDTVQVYVYPGRGGRKKEGEIVKIVREGRREFVGTVNVNRGTAFLVPDNNKLSFDIFITRNGLKNARPGDKAVVRLTTMPRSGRNPEGEVVRVLGKAGDNNTEMHAILLEYGLPYEFPKEVEREAKNIPLEIGNDEIAKRRDMRGTTTFTIDPVDAKDFDDALSVKELGNGKFEIGVHIADVSHYVKPGTLLDKEAYDRATSVYLVDRVVPMLPEVLSNQVCSLRPDEDKLCFSAIFEMDTHGHIDKEWFGRTVIRSVKRFTYEEAQEVLEKEEGPFVKELLLLNSIAKKMRTTRFNKGSIAFDKIEVKFHLDEKGDPTGVYFKQMKDSNQLIEEFMLLANRRVAAYGGAKVLKESKEKAPRPFVYRIHDSPNEEKLDVFASLVNRFGYKFKAGTQKELSTSMNRLMDAIKGKKEANMLETLAVRTMAKAIYSTDNIGHYGLAFEDYTHFTSPIRRYPDVLVHRLLQQYLLDDAQGGGKKKHQEVDLAELEEQCKHSSEREKKAAEAERSSIKYKQVQYLMDKIGQQFEGLISGVTDYGIFVELTESKCEGLVRFKELGNDVFEYDEENFCVYARRSKVKYQLGDRVLVEVKRADLLKKQLDFSLVRTLEE